MMRVFVLSGVLFPTEDELWELYFTRSRDRADMRVSRIKAQGNKPKINPWIGLTAGLSPV